MEEKIEISQKEYDFLLKLKSYVKLNKVYEQINV